VTKGRTLDDFRAVVDPFYKGDSPSIVFPWAPVKGARRYIITAAQNATPVHPEWWAVLQATSAELDAPLRVIPYRYKNPTSSWKGSQENVAHWAAELDGLLVSQRVQLNANLQLLADIKVQPTAADPVGYGDLHAISGACSAIVGHPKIQTRSIATPANRMAKLLMTSGACTQPNYSDTRAGRVGEFHHSLSAVLVELDGKRFYMRRLHFDAKSKSATDSAAGTRYTAKGAERAPRPEAIACGDLHHDFADPGAVAATIEMIRGTRPRYVIWHDAADGYPVNHHHGRNPFNKVAKRFSGKDDARAELQRLVAFMRKHTYDDVQHVIVAANHTDDFLARWIAEHDWRDDPTNADFYLETALHMVRATKMGDGGAEYPSPFKFWVDRAAVPQLRVLDRDESFVRKNVALDMHGDKGPNGARGSIRNLRRVGVKSIIGHGHSPGEDEGATQVGTLSRLRLEYNKGPSSWLHANAFLGDDGKRQLVVIVDGRYRL
jgi:hypothetical protein